MLPRVSVVGNLVADAVLKTSNGEKEFISFTIAASEGSGEEKKTMYVDVTYTKNGIIDHLKKGAKVYVYGKFSVSGYCKDDKAYFNLRLSARDIILF